jgi:hypothetical protein
VDTSATSTPTQTPSLVSTPPHDLPLFAERGGSTKVPVAGLVWPLSLAAQPHLRAIALARRERLARMSAQNVAIPVIQPARPPLPEPTAREQLLTRARTEAARACGPDAEPLRLTQVAIALLVFRMGLRAETVAREMALPRADVDHVVTICSEWLRRTRTSMIADIASCADTIATEAFVEASPVIEGFTEYSLAEVLRAVMGFYGIDAEALSGPSRTGDLVHARCVYACAARRATRATLVRIGESINRHHATLIPHIRTTEQRFATYHGREIDFSGADLLVFIADIDAALRECRA